MLIVAAGNIRVSSMAIASLMRGVLLAEFFHGHAGSALNGLNLGPVRVVLAPVCPRMLFAVSGELYWVSLGVNILAEGKERAKSDGSSK
jgi:hypothetical protein